MKNFVCVFVFVSAVCGNVHGIEDASKNHQSQTDDPSCTSSLSDDPTRPQTPPQVEASHDGAPAVKREVEEPTSPERVNWMLQTFALTKDGKESRFQTLPQVSYDGVSALQREVEEAISPELETQMLQELTLREVDKESRPRTPPQVRCNGVTAVKREVAESISQHEQGNWMLRRVTPMEDYRERFGDDQNFCSVFHHGPDCGTIQLFHMGSGNIITTAFNTRTKSVLITDSVTHSTDPYYEVDEDEIVKMENCSLQRAQFCAPVNPELIKKELESEYALVALAPHKRWGILRTCDKKVTWVKVLVPWAYPNNEETHQIIHTYDVEIEAKLRELQIVETLKLVPLYMPMELYEPE